MVHNTGRPAGLLRGIGLAGLAAVFVLVFSGCPPEVTTKSYTVTFAAGEGSGTPPAAQTADEGSSITLPGQGSMTAPTGKTFNGWSIGAEGGSYAVTADVTATAQWKGPDAPTGQKITIRNFAEGQYKDEVITKITIYEYDATKTNNQGTAHQTANGLSIAYGASWTDGLITKTGKYVVEVVVGANSWITRTTVEIYNITNDIQYYSYNGVSLVKQ